MRKNSKRSVQKYMIRVIVCPYIWSLLAIITLIPFTNSAKAQGNLIVDPLRAVFEGSKRLLELNVANTGKDTAVYAISLINIRMNKDGSFQIIDSPDSGQRFANDYIRFFPKRVVLAPNEAQMVKVQITQYNKLQPGEYRSHLYFRAVPQEQPLGKKDETPPNDESISVKIKAVFGISIPVIIKVGEPDVKVSLSDLSCVAINDSTQVLSLTFNRTGNMSAYGNLHVDYITPKGDAVNVAEAKGIAVYTPNTIRSFSLKLENKHEHHIDYKKGKLHIVYSQDKRSEKPVEADLELE